MWELKSSSYVNEKDLSTTSTREANVDAVSSRDPRHFLRFDIEGATVEALYDPGSVASFIGPRLCEMFKKQLKPYSERIEGAVGQGDEIIGITDLRFTIDGHSRMLPVKGVPSLKYDLILGVDFEKLFEVNTIHTGEWNVFNGEYHHFANSKRIINGIVSCAGLAETTNAQKEMIEKLLDKYITYNSDAPGLTHLTQHCIDVGDALPIKQRMRRNSPALMKEMHSQIDRMLEQDIIESSQSAWNSPPVMVKKADNSWRMCIDYRLVNAVTKKDAYPLPRIDTILDKLRCAKYISTIDLRWGYHHIPIHPNSREITALAVPGKSLFQFKRMPFGLTNAPANFQRLIDALITPDMEPYVFAYLDDIIIVTESFEDHLKWLENVLQKIHGAGLKVNREKSFFCRQSVRYLGYVVDAEGLRADTSKIEPILNYPAPKNVKELRRFLGMVGWYARFIDHLAELKLPLVQLLRKDIKFEWGHEQENAFNALKTALTEAPVLARPDFTLPFVIQCDASDYAIGAVLVQKHADGEHPICYISKVLTSAERNYSVTERECLSLLYAIQKFRPYIEGTQFEVVTDHSALTWLDNLKNPSGRLARWALELQAHDKKITHRKGALHHVPDALSRIPTLEECCATGNVSDT